MASVPRAAFVQLATGTARVASLAAFPRRSAAQASERLVVAVIPSDIAGQAYYAQDLGYFEKGRNRVEDLADL
jgi:ABC-type nitrate/sulfonate/bicarbonate transport system substrate-binding protein